MKSSARDVDENSFAVSWRYRLAPRDNKQKDLLLRRMMAEWALTMASGDATLCRSDGGSREALLRAWPLSAPAWIY